jgi:hypothetical protein
MALPSSSVFTYPIRQSNLFGGGKNAAECVDACASHLRRPPEESADLDLPRLGAVFEDEISPLDSYHRPDLRGTPWQVKVELLGFWDWLEVMPRDVSAPKPDAEVLTEKGRPVVRFVVDSVEPNGADLRRLVAIQVTRFNAWLAAVAQEGQEALLRAPARATDQRVAAQSREAHVADVKQLFHPPPWARASAKAAVCTRSAITSTTGEPQALASCA